MICDACKNIIPIGTEYCPYCGEPPLEQDTPMVQPVQPQQNIYIQELPEDLGNE